MAGTSSKDTADAVSIAKVSAVGGLQPLAETGTKHTAKAVSSTGVSGVDGLQPLAETGTKDSADVISNTKGLAVGGTIRVAGSQGGQAPAAQGKVADGTRISTESSQSASANVSPQLQARSSSSKLQRVPPVDFINGAAAGMLNLLQGTDHENSLLMQTVQKSVGLACLTLLCTALLLRAVWRFPSHGKLPTGRSLAKKVPMASEVPETVDHPTDR